jgi:nucleotide-binding universal stress UspA family protein
MTRRVLHPTDFSKASSAAFARSLTEAREKHSELVLVHVLSPVIPLPGAGEAYISPSMYEEMLEASRSWARKQMQRLLAKAKAARVRTRAIFLDGTPHEQIVRAARKEGAKLIVMGTHGRTGVARFFLGSVAARVTAMASCPVLTVGGRA